MWFETLTGFREKTLKQVRENISVDGNLLKSHVNCIEFVYGSLETPSLAKLRECVIHPEIESHSENILIREVIADAQQVHFKKSNTGLLFQVASQFNLLEIVSPYGAPEQGIANYKFDRTQGSVCAIAAGAGTIAVFWSTMSSMRFLLPRVVPYILLASCAAGPLISFINRLVRKIPGDSYNDRN